MWTQWSLSNFTATILLTGLNLLLNMFERRSVEELDCPRTVQTLWCPLHAHYILLRGAQLPELMDCLVLCKTRQRLEESVVVWIVCVILDLGEGKKLGSREGSVGRARWRLPKVDFSWGLRKGDWIVESCVSSRVGHTEPWRCVDSGAV